MEYITSSSGVKYSLNECNHYQNKSLFLQPLPYTEPAQRAFTKVATKPSRHQLTRSYSFTSKNFF